MTNYFGIAENNIPAFEKDLQRLTTSPFKRIYEFDICVRYNLTQEIFKQNHAVYIQNN